MPYVRVAHFWTDADVEAGRYVEKLYVLPWSTYAERGYITLEEAFPNALKNNQRDFKDGKGRLSRGRRSEARRPE
jgi:hypothetical protein